MYDLYPHQDEVIQELRDGYRAGHSRQVLAMATGAGKTVVAGQMALNAVKLGKRVLFIVHMTQLVIQSKAHFEALGLRVGTLQGENTDHTADDQVIVASIQTIRSRRAPDWIHLAIIDECHVLHKEHIKLMADWENVPFIGLSATPLREDLGQHFSNLVRGPTVSWLIDNDYLVGIKTFCPGSEHMSSILENVRCGNTTHGYDYNEKALGEAMNRKELVGDIVETWQKLGEDRQTLSFAVNVAHSKAIAEDFQAAGVMAAHIDHMTPAEEREFLIAGFRAGDIRILSSVMVLSIGFDVPDASCLILARPTKSETLHVQQEGRGIRSADGKTDCIVLDHAGNSLVHGEPKHFEVPDLQDRDRKEKETSKKPVRKMIACSQCGFALEPDQYVCPVCGIDRPKPAPKVHYLDGNLVEFGSLNDGVGIMTTAEKKHFYQQLLWYLRENNKKVGAAYYMYQAKFPGEKPRWAWRSLPPMIASLGTRNWITSYYIRSSKSLKKQQARQ